MDEWWSFSAVSPAPLYPDLWERDLCHFYRQVSSWRASAERCGLSLPPPPDRSTLLSPQMQWDQAKVYWDQLRSAWQQAAEANGVPGGMLDLE